MLIDALASAPTDVARMLRPLTADEATISIDNSWSIAQVVCHMAQIEPLTLARFERIVSQDNPREPFIHPDHAAWLPTVSANEWLLRFTEARAKAVNFLSTLTHQQWLRQCAHETLGVAKLHQMVRLLIAHDSEHLAQIVTLRMEIANGWRPTASDKLQPVEP